METGWKRNVLIIYCMERKNNMMRPLHIIMPMAGEGSRFRKEGWTTPKPLIELNEMPLFVRAIQSVAISDAGNGTLLKGTVYYSMDKEHWTEAGAFDWTGT